MIHYNEVSISKDGNTLTINVSIDDKPMYENTGIEKIYIDTDETWTTASPNSMSTSVNLNKVVENIFDDDIFMNGVFKAVKRTISAAELGLSTLNNHAVVVYVKAENVPLESPCGCDMQSAIVADLCPFYGKAVDMMSIIKQQCDIPKNAIDMVLWYKALQLNLKSNNVTEFMNLWNCKSYIEEKCGCNGTN